MAPLMPSSGDFAHTAYISVGSNMGDPLANCRNAIKSLEDSADCRVTGVSPFYRTEPVDYLDQDWFVNAAVRLQTRLSPLELLAELHVIEAEAGRNRVDAVRFGPRPLDLDIIFYDDLVLDTPEITLPHPRMHERRFVLRPLCDMEGELIHPILKKMLHSLLEMLDDPNQKIIRCENPPPMS